MMKRLVYGAVSAALLLGVTACGSGGGSDDKGSGSSKEPYKIGYMAILSGPNQTKGSEHAFELAVKQINDAGGVDGHKLEYKTFDTDITPEAAVSATNLAIRYGANALVGYPVSSGLKASIPAIKAAGIPVIHTTLGKLTSSKNLGYDLAFRLSPTAAQYAKAGDDYLVNEKHAKSTLIIHTQDSTPTEGAEEIQKDFKSKNLTSKVRSVSPTATDLTEPVLAARGSDSIWSWGYVTTDALAVKQAAQNGVKVPIMTFSVGTAIQNKLISSNLATDNVLQVSNCSAVTNPSTEAKKFVSDYKAAYGVDPTDALEARAYDGVGLLKAAIEKAGSIDNKKVGEALGEVKIEGVCGTLQADDNHNLYKNVPIIDYANAKPNLAKLEMDVTSSY